jgi:hypothetical protein
MKQRKEHTNGWLSLEKPEDLAAFRDILDDTLQSLNSDYEVKKYAWL